MIRNNRASLCVYSDTYTVAQISDMLGLEPESFGDIGDLTPSGRAGRNLKPQYLTYQRTLWSLHENSLGADAEDETGFSALRRLVERALPVADRLADLRNGGETIIWWSGDSDTMQGGFVLEVDLIEKLSVLGCPVYGTAFLGEGAEENEGS
ncbi:hypothetical protein [Microbacterium sp. SORGH_AS_0421]|uniref:hypothetical protein n=1 Tax=Microbacterium sp. SORGH_AS_0421 TaxID=3041768 RepID=UPI00278F3973|nr:hypothetical protein [Microbacterium sp. SORGH_AS_0421]MDQ1178335.1 hypothetical protein [Microbacterium sp. SORGH_AS_0421]